MLITYLPPSLCLQRKIVVVADNMNGAAMYELVSNHGVDTRTNGSDLDSWTPTRGYQIEKLVPNTLFCSILLTLLFRHVVLYVCHRFYRKHRSVLVTTSWSERSFVSTDTRPPSRSTRRLVRDVFIFPFTSAAFFYAFFFFLDLALADYRRGNCPGHLLLISTTSLLFVFNCIL